MKDLTQIYLHILKNGGATLNEDFILQTINHGFAVGHKLYAKKQITSFEDFFETISDIKYNPKKTGAYVGIWVDGNSWYFDEVFIFESLHAALLMGIIGNQISIWDFASKNEIKLGLQQTGTETQKQNYRKLAEFKVNECEFVIKNSTLGNYSFLQLL